MYYLSNAVEPFDSYNTVALPFNVSFMASYFPEKVRRHIVTRCRYNKCVISCLCWCLPSACRKTALVRVSRVLRYTRTMLVKITRSWRLGLSENHPCIQW